MLSQPNRHIAKYLKKQRQPDNETWSIMEYNMRNIFSKNYAENEAGEVAPDLFLFLQIA